MENNSFEKQGLEVVCSIFNFIIFKEDDFTRFSKLLMSYITPQTRHAVRYVLERLNWEALYHFHNHFIEVTRDQFQGFIQFAVRNRVDQALFYNSVQNLFKKNEVQHHLSVLSDLAGNHFPSRFGFIFFKALYRPFDIVETAREMDMLLHQTHLRTKLLELINLFQDMYFFITDKDYLLPIYKFCPNARNPTPMYQLEGSPIGEEIWDAMCNRTVGGSSFDKDDVYGKPLSMAYLWTTDCACCKLQIIVFKILLCAICN